MVVPPFALKAEIEIAERTGERDLSHVRRRSEARRRLLQRRKPARYLAGLHVEPFLLVFLGRAIAPLVDLQNRRIENAVGQRLEPQRVETRLALLRKNLSAARHHVEIFKDDG